MTVPPPPIDHDLDVSLPPPPLALGARVAVAMLAGPALLLVARFLLLGLGDDPIADTLSHLPSLLLLWCGVGFVTGTALGYLTGDRSSLLLKLALGSLVGAATVAVGMAVYSPYWPVPPADRERLGPGAVALMLASMGGVAGGILGAMAGLVADVAGVSFRRAMLRAVFCALAYTVWMYGRGH